MTPPLAGGAGASISGPQSETSAYAEGIAATSPQMKAASGSCGGDDDAGIFESAWDGLRRTGDNAVEYWADKATDPDSSGLLKAVSNVAGPFAALANCENAATTIATLTPFGLGGAGRFILMERAGGEAAPGVASTGSDDGASFVYRVHGGESRQWGASWTPTDPTAMSSPRAQLGLPSQNSGEFVTKARVKDWGGSYGRRATPLDGNAGGGIEYLFPQAEKQLEHVQTYPVVPPH